MWATQTWPSARGRRGRDEVRAAARRTAAAGRSACDGPDRPDLLDRGGEQRQRVHPRALGGPVDLVHQPRRRRERRLAVARRRAPAARSRIARRAGARRTRRPPGTTPAVADPDLAPDLAGCDARDDEERRVPPRTVRSTAPASPLTRPARFRSAAAAAAARRGPGSGRTSRGPGPGSPRAGTGPRRGSARGSRRGRA